MSRFVVTCKTPQTSAYRLIVSSSSDLSSPSYGSYETASDGWIRMLSPTLPSGAYYWGVQRNGQTLTAPRGRSKIAGPTHKIAWSSCAETASPAPVFSQIETYDPDMFFHTGDIQYRDTSSTNVADYLRDLELVFQSGVQASLYRNVPTIWMVDDHDGGDNDHEGNTAQARAAAEAWRIVAPYPAPLSDTASNGGRYFTWSPPSSRVQYIVTDQRRFASSNNDTDNINKTVLGATQKEWFKDTISDSAGMLRVWVCTRAWHYPATSNSDTWGAFTTERAEIANFIQANAPELVDVIYGDRHYGAMDSGTNCNYTTGGLGAGMLCGVGSPLDKNPSDNSSATFSEGYFRQSGIFGTLEVTDGGGDTITRKMDIRNASGVSQMSLTKVANLAA